jgi:xylulokinase
MHLLGYDIGSSSIKAALVDAQSGQTIQVVQYPSLELEIISRKAGWAEQHPESWWESLCQATKLLLAKTEVDPKSIKSIGIAYQMHGLVVVDEKQHVLRPAIIWCDSRAVDIGNAAFREIGEEKCRSHLLNSPANFTASKLKWVKDHEPALYQKIHKIKLPGDYIAMKLTGIINTTVAGLSEGMFWDFKNHEIASFLLDHYGIDKSLLPEIVHTFSLHGKVSREAAEDTGLAPGTAVTFRAGDQANNAMALGVFHPGEVAATGGTSGVIYGVIDHLQYDPLSRINSFAHVNHSPEDPRLGLLLCINGAGIQYSWLKKQVALPDISYPEMERISSSIPIGSDGLRVIPFGNGAERMLDNQSPGAHFVNVQFNRHSRGHFYRAGLEGIAFSFVYGGQILKELGVDIQVLKVGNDNLFQSEIFSTTIANLLNCRIEIINTTGAAGAAKASGIGTGYYRDLEEAITTNEVVQVYAPGASATPYQQAYQRWKNDLQKILNK